MRNKETCIQLTVLIVCSMAAMDSAHAQRRGVINNEQSPYATLKSIDARLERIEKLAEQNLARRDQPAPEPQRR